MVFLFVQRILFVCTHNSARSQMAEAILKEKFGDRFEVVSAGTKPTRVNPFAIEVLREINIDISKAQSKNITTEILLILQSFRVRLKKSFMPLENLGMI
ncbi:MAG: arsenate reductase ArsC [Candidatus Hodarchaeales archaeon]